MGRGQELGSLHISFVRYWVGWVYRSQKARRPLYFLSGLLGLFVLSPRMDGPRSQKWALLASQPRLLPSRGSLYVPFSGWVVHGKKNASRSVPFMLAFWAPGEMGRGQEAGIRLPSCFLSGLLGGIPISFLHSDGWAAAKKLGFIGLTSYLLSGC